MRDNHETIDLYFPWSRPFGVMWTLLVIHFAASDDYDPPCTTNIDLTIIVEQSAPTDKMP